MTNPVLEVVAWIFAALAGTLLGWTRLRPFNRSWAGWEFWALSFIVSQMDGSPLDNSRLVTSPLEAAFYGLLFALGYAGWMLWHLRLPVVVSALLACSQTLVWTVFALGAWRLWQLPFPLDVLGVACWGAFLFWLEWSLLPLWGTAQNFACSSPANRPFIAWFGTAGGTWSLLCLASWFHATFSRRNSWLETVLIGASGIAIFLALQSIERLWFSPKSNSQTLRVAVFGWAGNAFDALTELPAEFQTAARQASEQGARLLVTPEAAIQVQNRAHFRVSLCTLALKYNLALAVGYFDQKQNQNCIDFVSAQGEVVSRYVKTHLVPVFERYNAGKGELALMDVDGIQVGGLVCQDDNFPDIARKYGKAGAQLLAIPTNDWKGVKDVHFANHRWRALENRFALARATSDGISSLTSNSGEVLSSSDHFGEGAKLLVADVAVGSGKATLYAKTGDWFPVACGLAAIVGLFFAR